MLYYVVGLFKRSNVQIFENPVSVLLKHLTEEHDLERHYFSGLSTLVFLFFFVSQGFFQNLLPKIYQLYDGWYVSHDCYIIM